MTKKQLRDMATQLDDACSQIEQMMYVVDEHYQSASDRWRESERGEQCNALVEALAGALDGANAAHDALQTYFFSKK